MANQDFPDGDASPRGRGVNLLFGKRFVEKCMKMKEIGRKDGRASPALLPWIRQWVLSLWCVSSLLFLIDWCSCILLRDMASTLHLPPILIFHHVFRRPPWELFQLLCCVYCNKGHQFVSYQHMLQATSPSDSSERILVYICTYVTMRTLLLSCFVVGSSEIRNASLQYDRNMIE